MPASDELDARPVRTFLPGADVRVDESRWPASVPVLDYLSGRRRQPRPDSGGP
jgi:hypothetical protein